MFGLELNDRALALARDGELLGAEPSAVLRDADGERYGLAAWQALRRVPGQVSLRHLGEIAGHRAAAGGYALLTRELRARCADLGEPADPAWIALAQHFDAAAMGELLSVLRAAGIGVAGFVDSAAAIAAWLGLTAPALVLDLGLQRCTLTLVVPGEAGQQLRRASHLDIGYLDLLERWLALAAEAMVKRTRFDPLHDARHDQQLFDLLPVAAADAQLRGESLLRMPVADSEIELSVSRDQFVTAVAPLQAQLQRALLALRPAGRRCSLLVPQALLALPGFAAAFAGVSASELLGLPDGLAARAASSLPAAAGAGAASVQYLTRLPQAAGPRSLADAGVTRIAADATAAAPRAATHVIFEGRARAIDAQGLVLGREPEASSHTLRLGDGVAGLSRRHCTLLRQDGATWIIDHSTHGSFLDGEAVAGRAPLHAGSVLRLGTPGIELPLIAVD
ncbi:MAG TPA: FHA domain-containing protein [Steroidobacteraceae bacterium]|jgi:hypothetical protein|nr:FHA domain-containing protein [Steroidobacteraceae bacterium]